MTPAQVSVDAQDRMTQYGTAAFAYNANGDLVSKTEDANVTHYSYDEFGNLIEVILPSGDVIDYLIDGLNRRVGKKVNGALVKRWLYDGKLRIVAELDGAGTVDKRFVYASKINVPEYYTQGGNTFRIVTDYLGSPRLVIDTATNAIVAQMNHDEYGRVTQDTNPELIPFGYAGGLYDADTGFVRLGARDYDPELGRWPNKDPIRFGGNATNLFEYSFGDPINLTDFNGMTSLEMFEQVAAGSINYAARHGRLLFNAMRVGRVTAQTVSWTILRAGTTSAVESASTTAATTVGAGALTTGAVAAGTVASVYFAYDQITRAGRGDAYAFDVFVAWDFYASLLSSRKPCPPGTNSGNVDLGAGDRPAPGYAHSRF